MSTDTLLLAIIGHLVGDYLAQRDWMAIGKKKHWWPCTAHCAIWAVSVWLFTWSDWPAPGWHWSTLPVLFILHYAIDRTQFVRRWMEWNGQRAFMEPPRLDLMDMRVIPGFAPWSLIVVDNVWHIVQLWFVWRFLA